MIFRFSILFLVITKSWAQLFYSPIDVATAGSALGGGLGTHVIQTNPALLGIGQEDIIPLTSMDTMKIFHRIRLAVSDNVQEIMMLEDKLTQAMPEHDFIIQKSDTIFALETQNFSDLLSASVFADSLPKEYTNYEVITDTISEMVYIPDKEYRIQLIATTEKDSLRAFKKKSKAIIKSFGGNTVFIDSMYKYRIGRFVRKQDAKILKDSLINAGLFSDAFIVLEERKPPKKRAPKFSISLPLSFSVQLGNNVFDVDKINNYLVADMVENPSIKSSLLSSVPKDGLSGHGGSNASILSLTYKSYGLSLFDIDIYQRSDIPKSIFQTIFQGVFFNQPLDISDFDANILIANNSIFSFGKRVETFQSSFKTYAGFGLRILTGGFGEVQSFSGNLETKQDSIIVNSNMEFSYGFPASGVGLDMGIYAEINKKMATQISIIGIGGSLRSSDTEVRQVINKIQLSNTNIEEIVDYDNAQTDSLANSFVILDTTYVGNAKRIPVPGRINLGIQYRLHRSILFHGSLQQSIQTDFIGKIPTRIALGSIFFPDKSLPLMVGFAVGGKEGFYAGAGLGIKTGPLQLNLGLSQSGGIANSATGFNLAMDLRLLF